MCCPPPPLLRALRPVPLGVGVICDFFFFITVRGLALPILSFKLFGHAVRARSRTRSCARGLLARVGPRPLGHRPRLLVGLRLARCATLLALRCSKLLGAGCATRSARRVAELLTSCAATLHQLGVAPARGSNLLLQSRVPALSRQVYSVQRFGVRVDGAERVAYSKKSR